MIRQSPTLRKFSRRGVRIRRVTVILFLGVLGALGIRLVSGRATTPAPDATSVSPDTTSSTPGVFTGMRPRAGDCMAPPRLGFRWCFDAHQAESVLAGMMDASRSPKAAESRSGASKADPNAISRASLVPSFLSEPDSVGVDGDIVFRLHVVGVGGSPEIIRETDRDQIYVDLDERFGYGECEWWVEAVAAGRPVLQSERERFTLRP